MATARVDAARPNSVLVGRLPDGVTDRYTYDTPTEARKKAVVFQQQLDAGVYVAKKAAKTQFAVVAEEWFIGKLRLEAGSRANIRSILNLHLKPEFVGKEVGDIERVDVARLVKRLNDLGMSGGTTRKIFFVLRQVMEQARIDRKITHNPCDGVELPKEPMPEEMHFLTTEQVMALAAAVEPRYRFLIIFAWQSGLRAGEIWALRRDQVHLKHEPPRIEVRESTRDVAGSGLITKAPKNDKRRWVTISPALAQMLAAYMLEYPSADGYVFVSPGGHQVRHRNFYDRVFLKAVGNVPSLPAALRFHDLRHSCASWLAANGLTLAQVGKHLGHSDTRVTERYVHLFPGHEAGIATAGDTALEDFDEQIAAAGDAVLAPATKRRRGRVAATNRDQSVHHNVIPMPGTQQAPSEKGA